MVTALRLRRLRRLRLRLRPTSYVYAFVYVYAYVYACVVNGASPSLPPPGEGGGEGGGVELPCFRRFTKSARKVAVVATAATFFTFQKLLDFRGQFSELPLFFIGPPNARRKCPREGPKIEKL